MKRMPREVGTIKEVSVDLSFLDPSTRVVLLAVLEAFSNVVARESIVGTGRTR
jgi:hypothetical protein